MHPSEDLRAEDEWLDGLAKEMKRLYRKGQYQTRFQCQVCNLGNALNTTTTRVAGLVYTY
jgi:hypothetical protein